MDGTGAAGRLRVAVCGITPESVHLMTYVRYLADCGHDVTLITNKYEADAPVRVVNFARHTRLIRVVPRGLRAVVRASKLWSALRSGPFDVVSVQQMTPDGVLAALLSPVPCVPTCWGSDILRLDKRPGWVRALMPRALKRGWSVHATSVEIEERVVGMGVPRARVETFNYGVDLAEFRLRDAPPDSDVVVSTRGLGAFYRADALIEAWPLVRERRPAARLVLAGNGLSGDLERLRNMAEELGVADAVGFTGVIDPDQVAALLRNAAVWASLPPTDAVAISLQEAMASGALPLVSDLPSMHEGLRDGVGLFATDLSPEALSSLLIEALDRAESRAHEGVNRAAVVSYGDRSVNLARWESMLMEAAGSGRNHDAGSTAHREIIPVAGRAHRIAICTSVHPSSDARITFREGRCLASAFDTTLYVLEDGPDGAVEASEGRELAIHRLGKPHSRLSRAFAGRRLLRTALADRPDAIIVMDPELLPWLRALAVGRVATVYDAHEDYALMMLTKPWVPAPLRKTVGVVVDVVERSVLRRVDLLVVADAHLLDRLGRTRIASVVVRNYPPTDLLAVGPSLVARGPVISYVGGISPQRGLSTMLEAFRVVRERIPSAELRLVGPAQDGVAYLLRSAGRGVTVTGRLPYDRIAEELARSRVGLALLADTPKYRRDVPSKLYDYMSAGVPYVASDLPGIRSAIGEIGGLLVDPGDPKAAADAIVRLLTDDELAQALRDDGSAAAHERFSFETECTRIVGALHAILDGSSGPNHPERSSSCTEAPR
jgi:glycosyltransferase involved in cell wall biosynthesis